MPIIEIVKDKAALSIPCTDTTLDAAMPVIRDLMDTANAHKDICAGLAANQIGSNLRVFVVKVRGKFIAFINPSFSPIKAKITVYEGCLSFPGKKTEVKRYPVIHTSPPVGKKKGMTLDGIAAIAVQHELDHLNGVCI